MGCAEMKTEEKPLARACIIFNDLHRPIAKKGRHIAGLRYWLVSVPKVRLASRVDVEEIVDRAASISVKMIIPAFQRTKFRQVAEVPFADQRRAVTDLLQKRRQSRMFWRQANARLCDACNRLFHSDRQSGLVTACYDSNSRAVQTGELAYAWEKRAPCTAMRSMFGVMKSRRPLHEISA